MNGYGPHDFYSTAHRNRRWRPRLPLLVGAAFLTPLLVAAWWSQSGAKAEYEAQKIARQQCELVEGKCAVAVKPKKRKETCVSSVPAAQASVDL